MVTLTLRVAVVVLFFIVAPLADLFPSVIKGTHDRFTPIADALMQVSQGY
jgi:hypothetical protein